MGYYRKQIKYYNRYRLHRRYRIKIRAVRYRKYAMRNRARAYRYLRNYRKYAKYCKKSRRKSTKNARYCRYAKNHLRLYRKYIRLFRRYWRYRRNRRYRGMALRYRNIAYRYLRNYRKYAKYCKKSRRRRTYNARYCNLAVRYYKVYIINKNRYNQNMLYYRTLRQRKYLNWARNYYRTYKKYYNYFRRYAKYCKGSNRLRNIYRWGRRKLAAGKIQANRWKSKYIARKKAKTKAKKKTKAKTSKTSKSSVSYTSHGKRYCTGYSSYTRHKKIKSLSKCTSKCTSMGSSCNSIGLGTHCITYKNCKISPKKQNWKGNWRFWLKKKAKKAAASRSLVKKEVTPESHRSYSSIWSNNRIGTGHARSTINSPQAWSAKYNNKRQYMTLDLRSTKKVVGVRTQGRHQRKYGNQYVKSFKVLYSNNNRNWNYVDKGITFKHSTRDNRKIITTSFAIPVTARYIRIQPQSWNRHISMRVDVLTARR